MIQILSSTLRTPWLDGHTTTDIRTGTHLNAVYPCGCRWEYHVQEVLGRHGLTEHLSPVAFTACARHEPLLTCFEEYVGQLAV